MFHVKRLALLLPVFCLCLFLVGCGMGNGKAKRSSSEMEDVREVRIDAEAALLEFAPDGTTLAVYRHEIQLWDASTGKMICEADKKATIGGCRSFAFSPDGTRLAAAYTRMHDLSTPEEFRVYLWEITPDKHLDNLEVLISGEIKDRGCPSPIFNTHFRPSFSSDGSALAVATPDGKVRVWDTESGKERVEFPGGVGVCFASDGRTLVTVTRGGVVHRWEADAGKVVRLDQDDVPDGYICVDGIAFDAAAKRVTINDRYAVCVKDTETGRTVSRMESRQPISFGVAPDQTLLVASEGCLRFVDSVTGDTRGWLRHQTGFGRALAISPDGKRVAWSDEKSVLIQSWTALAGRAEIEMEPAVEAEFLTPLKAELIANTDTYELDLGGTTAEEFTNRAWPGKEPPAVDLSFRICNLGSQPVSLRVWGEAEVTSMWILGDGAFNYSPCSQTGVQIPDIKIVSLPPGESFSFPVKKLGTIYNLPFWLLPGEYTVHASAYFAVSPPPQGVRVDEDGFGFVHFNAEPAKVKVRLRN